jgi:hypothetical protein
MSELADERLNVGIAATAPAIAYKAGVALGATDGADPPVEGEFPTALRDVLAIVGLDPELIRAGRKELGK